MEKKSSTKKKSEEVSPEKLAWLKNRAQSKLCPRPLWQRIFLCTCLILGILFMYMLGSFHGFQRASFAGVSNHCEVMPDMVPIYPYGCEHSDLQDTACVVMDCQAFSLGATGLYNTNGAICGRYNVTGDTFGKDGKVAAFITGFGLSGCPMRVESIGINPRTGNRNWAIKVDGRLY